MQRTLSPGRVAALGRSRHVCPAPGTAPAPPGADSHRVCTAPAPPGTLLPSKTRLGVPASPARCIPRWTQREALGGKVWPQDWPWICRRGEGGPGAPGQGRGKRRKPPCTSHPPWKGDRLRSPSSFPSRTSFSLFHSGLRGGRGLTQGDPPVCTR